MISHRRWRLTRAPLAYEVGQPRRVDSRARCVVCVPLKADMRAPLASQMGQPKQ